MSIVNINKISYASHLLKQSFWQYRSGFLTMLIFGLLTGFFGSIGIGAIIPLFAFLINKRGDGISSDDFITVKLNNFFEVFHIENQLFFLMSIIVVLFVLKALSTYWATYVNEKVSADYEKQTRGDLFQKTMEADWPYLMEQKTGHLESVLMNDVYGGVSILQNISTIIMTATSLIMYAFVAINISASITLITLGLGIILFLFSKPLFYKIRKTAHDLSIASREINHHVSQHMIGSKTVKATSSESEVIKTSRHLFEDLSRMRVTIALYNKAPGTFLEPIGLIFISFIFIFYYYTNSDFNIASFAAIIYLVQKKFSFMQSIQAKLNNINEALPQLKNVYDFRNAAITHKETDDKINDFSFSNKLELKNISFSYDGTRKILSEINLSVRKGEMIGLIGPSGAGKTTLVDILLRLFKPGAGEILIDGRNIFEINIKNWRKKVGYVSQDIFLLNDTITNNIRFYNNEATEQEIIKAARMANIYDFVQGLPQKFDTIVGERGVRLSGGQRQRIILARTLARKPEILILDEATSALDNESEVLIQKSIEDLKRTTTVIAIAHRLTTVMNSDRLIILENGKITEEGSPVELLENKDSYFYKLYNIRES